MHITDRAAAGTRGARLFDDRPLPLALIAGSRDAEEALLKANLATTATRGARLGRGSRFCAVPPAGIAGPMARDFDFLFDPGNRLFKLERQRVAEILAAATPPCPAAAKKFAENIAENVFEAAGKIDKQQIRSGVPGKIASERAVEVQPSA